jgi:hypothetical protein
MPLTPSDLSDGLEDLFEDTGGFPADEAEAGKRWAKAYKDYAADALAGPTTPVAASLTAAEATLAEALAAGFGAAKAAGPGGVATVVALLDTAFVAFWLTPPVAFVAPPLPPPAIAGVVTLAPPGVLSGGLTGPLTSGTGEGTTAAGQAQLLAAVLDTWTRTVMVLNTPITPPGPPVTVPLT